MRLAFVLALVLTGRVAHAEPDVLKLDAPAAANATLATCVRDGHATPGPDHDIKIKCKALASRAIAGRKVQVIAVSEGMEDDAEVELAADGGAVYVHGTTMHYTPGMGERSSPVQTKRDWSQAPVIEAGTLADKTPAAIVRIPWTSQDFDRTTGHSLGPVQGHAVVLVCAIGKSPGCSSRIDLECPAKGCTAKLEGGVLTLTTSDGTRQHQVR